MPEFDTEELIRIWQQWDRRPGDPTRARALCDAVAAYAGPARAIALRSHVNERRKAGLTLAAAIYSWIPDEPT